MVSNELSTAVLNLLHSLYPCMIRLGTWAWPRCDLDGWPVSRRGGRSRLHAGAPWYVGILWYYWSNNSLSSIKDPAGGGGSIHVCWTDCRVNIVPTLLLSSVHTQAQSTERCETQCVALPITHWHGSVLHTLPHWGNLWQPHQDVSLPRGKKQTEEGLLLPTKHRDDGSVCDRRGVLTIQHISPSFEASDYQPSKQALTRWSCWTANSSWALRPQKHQGK